jgi:hypothetical protein
MSAICITFGEQSENHFGMTKNGNGLSARGYTIEEIILIRDHLMTMDIKCEIIALHKEYNYKIALPESYILKMYNCVGKLIGNSGKNKMFTELKNLDWDTQYWDQQKQRVLNKHARYNLCFDNEYTEADFENKQGTIITYSMVPQLKKLRNKLIKIFKELEFENINFQTEGNYYYDIEKTGIGFHGDAERKCVIGTNLSDRERQICWQWYHHSQPITEPYILELSHGDMYIMSENASGFNWKTSSIPTLRHAAGVEGSKYLEHKF